VSPGDEDSIFHLEIRSSALVDERTESMFHRQCLSFNSFLRTNTERCVMRSDLGKGLQRFFCVYID
jgi:hypothetical protein